VNEVIKIQVICVKGKIISGLFSAPLTLWMRDTNGRWWTQPLFFPYNKIYQSLETTGKEFKEYTDEDTILECFDGKKFW